MMRSHLLVGFMLALILAAGCTQMNNIVWQRRYDSGQEDFGRVVVTDGNDVIVGGIWRDTTPEEIVVDWQIVKYDAQGNLVWRRIYDSGGLDWLADLIVSEDHSLTAVGSTMGPGSDSLMLLLVRFSPQGEVVWDYQYVFGQVCQGLALCPGPDDGVTACGFMFGGNDTFNDDDILLADFDAGGNLVRWESLNFGADETGQDLVRDHKGNLVLIAGQVPLAQGADSMAIGDLMVVKLDTADKTLWRHLYDSGEDDFAGSLALDSLDDIYAATTFSSDKGTGMHLLEYDPHGVLKFDRAYAGQANPSCMSLKIDRNGVVLGAGAIGPGGAQRYLCFRFLRNWFADLLDPQAYHSGASDLANSVALDQENNVVITGISDAGTEPDIMTIKLRNPKP